MIREGFKKIKKNFYTNWAAGEVKTGLFSHFFVIPNLHLQILQMVWNFLHVSDHLKAKKNQTQV